MSFIPGKNAQWRTLQNVASLISGRMFISLSRLVIALIIVRLINIEIFGVYVVVMTIIFIGEWLIDFGLTDIAVRNISQDRNTRIKVLNAFTTIKILQSIVAYSSVILAIYLLGFDELALAASIGGLALVFYGGAQIYRVDFRVNMEMYKDVLAESSGVLVNIILVLLLSLGGATVLELVACHAVSRLIYLGVNIYFGSRQYKPYPDFRDRLSLSTLARESAPLGLAGIMVISYDSIIPLVLSKLVSMDAVAQYAVAIRLVFPIVLVTQAISNVFYTPLSRYWNSDKKQFVATQQNLVEIICIVACGFFCVVFSGADFIVSLFGDEMSDSAIILQLLSWAIIARAMTIAMSSPIIICGGQKKTMWLTLIVVIFSTLLVIYLVPQYGIMGAVGAYLFVEIVITAIPVVFVSLYMANYRLCWAPVAKIFIATGVAISCISLSAIDGSLSGGLLSGLIFFLVAYLTGGISRQKLRALKYIVKLRSNAQ